MTYLVTGGCGFVGSNITDRLLRDGRDVTVFDNLSRNGTPLNLQWLRGQGLTNFVHGDIRNQSDVENLIAAHKPEVIFHLCGQVAMTTSMQNPRHDFEVNVLGSINLLESVRRHCPKTTVVYSSSNKVYGDLDYLPVEEAPKRYLLPTLPDGVDETAKLDFRTPYGCSKGAADQYMLDYARNWGLNTAVFRHSTIFGGRQFATYDQGWVGWFCQQALLQKKDPASAAFTISGDGKQVRDLLFVEDAVECYLAAAANIDKARGEPFNIGGGIANSSSLLELFDMLEGMLDVKLRWRPIDWRFSDQKVFVANNAKARRILGWSPKVAKRDGVVAMCRWLETCSA